MKLTPLFVVAALSVGCSFEPGEPEAPAFDHDAPRVHIVSPVRGTFAGDVTHVNVIGTATDDSGIVATVTVNGVPASLAGDGTWHAEVPVTPGTNLLHAIAIDARHNKSTQTRAVVVGPTVALDQRVAGGIRATLSAQALSTLGRDTATFIEAGGLEAAAQKRNPFVDVGGGPDCLYSQASITSLTVESADVQMVPTTGGIAVSAVLDNVSITTHLQWAVSCLADSRDVVMSAQRVTVQGLLTVGVVEHALDVQFDHPNVQVTGFDLQITDVPEEIMQWLELDRATSVILGLTTERLVVPMVERSLAALDATTTLDVAGVQVDADVEPVQVSFTPEGGAIVLGTSVRARGDSGGFVFVPNAVPTLDMTSGFELAVADDATNQLLTSLWSVRAFDTAIDLDRDSPGSIARYYDSAQLQLVMPPHVVAFGSPLELTVGDLIASFKRGDTEVTVAIHAKSALYVIEDTDGTLRMDVSVPAVDIDVVHGGDSLTKNQLQAIRTFALERVRALGSAAVAAIPLPALGNVMLTTPWLDSRAGYLRIVGDVE